MIFSYVIEKKCFSSLTLFQFLNSSIVNTRCVGCPNDLLKRKHGRQNAASLSHEYSSHERNRLNHEDESYKDDFHLQVLGTLG
jgi:hypothetical protein